MALENLKSQLKNKLQKFQVTGEKMKVKLSVIIPVYNVEDYLKQCLESVINQTLKEIEIICVNDGSTDNSKQILEDYANKDKRIKIINKKNAGLGAARNTGMEYAKGEYIGFVDSDDWVDKNAFKKLYENAKSNNSDIVICPIKLINEKNGEEIQDPYYHLECFSSEFDIIVFDYKKTKNFLLDIAVNAYNKIYKNKFIKDLQVKFPEGLLFEDIPFFYQTYLNAKRISLIRDFLIFHRINRESSITSKVDKKHFDTIQIQNLMIKTFLKIPDFQYFKIELFNKKIFRIINRYFEIDDLYKEEFFRLIKQDFEEMVLTENEIEKLDPGIKKYYQNVINSTSYIEFELKEEGKFAKSLVISFCFPPYIDTSGNVMAKRVRQKNKIVDVIQNDMSEIRSIDSTSNLITEGLVEDQIIINSSPFFGSWKHVKDFCKKGMINIKENIEKKGEYDDIYSRAMFPASHFLAFEYKIAFPNVKWTAEFSDPVIYDTEGKIRESKINDQKFIEKLNQLLLDKGISEYNGNNLFFLCEYIPYVFADEIIFTNENQKKFMINKFPINEIKENIEKKSKIKRHPTLEKKFYNLVESEYLLDNNFINLAYFGRDYETRNLRDIFLAIYGLNNKLKDKCKIHFFTSDVDSFKESMICSPIEENIIVNKYVNFLEFLNLTTKFDCLIVNDAKKEEGTNPYLPSKLSDYLGSNTDIWIIYEEGSTMSKFDVKYRSILGDVKSSRKLLKNILEDNSK